MFKKVAGCRDILPEQAGLWQRLEQISREVFTLYNYKEIRTPLLEESSLFNRSLGEVAEIVQKQMFIFQSETDSYALRPEGTASVVRAYIENNLDKASALAKLYYIGPMFRRERPQKGRLRQFHHVGCEVLGSRESGLDIEVISLMDALLKSFAIVNYRIKLNSLGCAADKKNFADFLRKNISHNLSKLCPECNIRYNLNVMRILDCKNTGCQDVIRDLKIQDTCLCQECAVHFTEVKNGLDLLGVKYEVSPYLVRGLDYYTRTVFEITHDSLESQQNAIGAGGRYDNLIKEVGGPDLGAIGFAFGMERLFLVMQEGLKPQSKPLIYAIGLGDEARKQCLLILDELRKNGIASDTDYENKSIKGAMRKANDLGAEYVLILGDDEIKKNTIMLKQMSSGKQEEVKREELVGKIKCYTHIHAVN